MRVCKKYIHNEYGEVGIQSWARVVVGEFEAAIACSVTLGKCGRKGSSCVSLVLVMNNDDDGDEKG